MTPLTETVPNRAFAPFSGASERAVQGLAGSVLAGRFRYWQGRDGRRHLFSVFAVGPGAAIDDVPRFEDAVVFAVARDPSGARRVLFADETGPLPDLIFAGAGIRAALTAGANEIHVHLLTESAAGRAALLHDLAGR